MMMYRELIEDLRRYALASNLSAYLRLLLARAADAIEELGKED